MERAAIRVVEALMQRGIGAHFVLDADWADEVRAAVNHIGAEWTGVPFVATFSRPRTFLEARLALRSYARSAYDLERAAERFRPRQMLATSLNSAYFARRIARHRDIRSVFRLPNPPGISPLPGKAALDRIIWRAVYADYDALVCNSHYTAARLASVVGDDRRIHVIRNFLPALDRKGPSDVPDCDPKKINVVYLGQISRAKGVDILIEAALAATAARADVDFILVGPDVWQDAFGEMIRRRIVAAGAVERIRLTGAISDVHGLLRRADIHVCPSVGSNESFPNVVLDAKQAGVPSIVFSTGGLPEAVTDGVDGIVTAEKSVDALRDALLDLCADASRRRRLAEGARRSLEAYAQSSITDSWADLFFGRS